MRTGRIRMAGAALLGIALAAGGAGAVTVENLDGLDDIFGRYAPGGDCQRQPRITVERSGMTFEVGGKTETVHRVEYAASYGGNAYDGISKWIFPFGQEGNWPILMTFHDGEKRGALAITPQDAGWPGGPPLAAREKALVDASPYARCQ